MTKKTKIIGLVCCIVLALGLAAIPVGLVLGRYNVLGLKSAAGAAKASEYGGAAVIDNGYLKLSYDTAGGTYAIAYNGHAFTSGAHSYAAVIKNGGDKKEYDSASAKTRDARFNENYTDDFGGGAELSVANFFEDGITLTQNFRVYNGGEYLVSDITVSDKDGAELASNDMRQILADNKDAKTELSNMKNISFLDTPFDNNDYSRYSPIALGNGSGYTAYGFTMLFNRGEWEALVIGALDNSVFKNAAVVGGSKRAFGGSNLDELYLHYGKVSWGSHDYNHNGGNESNAEHGYVKGGVLTSPRMFYGYYADYRNGLEAYGDAANTAEPTLKWEGDIPVGYNSWAALAFGADYDKMTEMSDYVKNNLGDFGSGDNVYLNMDASFSRLTREQRAEFVRYAASNGQKAGCYWTPFSGWHGGSSEWLDRTFMAGGVTYTNRDVVVKYENGDPVLYNDAYTYDVTHPAVQARMRDFLDDIISWGYRYIKMDFVLDGTLEGVRYDPSLASTGMEAYNYGLKFIYDYIAANSPEPIFLNLAISPVFSGQYVHSRRLCCDVFETIGNTEYLLNTLSYAWWMNGRIISVADPDHTVTYLSFDQSLPANDGQADAVVISRVISGGLILFSDDIAHDGAKKRLSYYLNNKELTRLAAKGKAFRPAKPGGYYSDTFVLSDGGAFYAAVFNLKGVGKAVSVPLPGAASSYGRAADIITGKSARLSGNKLKAYVGTKSAAIVAVEP